MLQRERSLTGLQIGTFSGITESVEQRSPVERSGSQSILDQTQSRSSAVPRHKHIMNEWIINRT